MKPMHFCPDEGQEWTERLAEGEEPALSRVHGSCLWKLLLFAGLVHPAGVGARSACLVLSAAKPSGHKWLSLQRKGGVGGSPSPLPPGPWCGRVWEKPHCTCAPWQAARVCSEPPSHAILCFLTAGTWGPVCPVLRGVISLRLWRPLHVLVWPWPPPADGQEVLLKQQWGSAWGMKMGRNRGCG